MKIYTRTGDSGTSSLNDGYRTNKESVLFSLLGELDELSSRIGMLCAVPCDAGVSPFLRDIQRKIHTFNAHLASPTKTEGKYIPTINPDIVTELEKEIDRMDTVLPKLTNFILPGCYQLDSQAHLCRTQTRKVERKLWKVLNYDIPIELTKGSETIAFILNERIKVNPLIPQYINRLSDYFFVLARWFSYLYDGVETIV